MGYLRCTPSPTCCSRPRSALGSARSCSARATLAGTPPSVSPHPAGLGDHQDTVGNTLGGAQAVLGVRSVSSSLAECLLMGSRGITPKPTPGTPNPTAELAPGRGRGQSSRAGSLGGQQHHGGAGGEEKGVGPSEQTWTPLQNPKSPCRAPGLPAEPRLALQNPGSLCRTPNPPAEPLIPLQNPKSPCRTSNPPAEP